jgi:HSP20 family protein
MEPTMNPLTRNTLNRHEPLSGRLDGPFVEIEGSEVTISAEARRESAPTDGEKWLRSERFHGKAGRRFALSRELDEARAVAKFADGVLELTLPEKAAVAGRKVEIN